jgi:uncharacterized protein YceH (UPF0502 family)
MTDSVNEDSLASDSPSPPQPLNPRQRRILGVLMEKARTTPDAYPLSLNGLVTGCNQKSNRHPLMHLEAERVEAELEAMRADGVVAEVQGGSRVPKYRHYGYDYLGVRGVEAAIMTELLLRGEQTAGELRTRASRFEPIADLPTLLGLLDSLRERGLVITLTPAGRGQLFTHNLYQPDELELLVKQYADGAGASRPVAAASGGSPPGGTQAFATADDLQTLREEVRDLRTLVEQLSDRLERLES